MGEDFLVWSTAGADVATAPAAVRLVHLAHQKMAGTYSRLAEAELDGAAARAQAAERQRGAAMIVPLALPLVTRPSTNPVGFAINAFL